MPPGRPALAGTIIVLASATLYGTLGVLSRTAYAAGMVPFAFVAWRALIGAIGIASVGAVMDRRGWPIVRLSAMPPATRRALGISILLSAAWNISIFLAFQRTTVALAVLGFYTYPAMIAGASVVLGRERLDRVRIAALVLALGGMAAVVLGAPAAAGAGISPGSGTGGLEVHAAGVALALLAALFQTLWVLQSRSYSAIPAHQAMAINLGGSSVIAAALAAGLAGPLALTLPFSSPPLLVLLLGTGLLAAALPSILFLTGVRRIGGVRTGILMLFEPVVGVALAAVFLAEAVSPVQALGGAAILAAAVLVHGRGAVKPLAEARA